MSTNFSISSPLARVPSAPAGIEPDAVAPATVDAPPTAGPVPDHVPGPVPDPEVSLAARLRHVASGDSMFDHVSTDRPSPPPPPLRRGLGGRTDDSPARVPAAGPAFTLGPSAADGVAARNGFTDSDLVEMLRGLGYEQPNFNDALRALQADAGLPVTGSLDIETLMAILGAALNQDRRSRAHPAGSPHGGVGAGRPGGPGNVPDAGRAISQTAPVDVSNWKPGAGDVTPKQLQAIVPTLSAQKAAEVAPHLNRAMAEAGIDSPARKAAFVAQVAHESGGFKYNEEIASGRAYEGRRDLGNTQPGDGERFKGRGYIQLTGRANYEAAGKALGLDLVKNPELAARPENAARVAAWYWNSRGLNGLADRGNFDGITKRINGGYNGKADRDQYHARAQQTLKDCVGLPSTGKFIGGGIDPSQPQKQLAVPAMRQQTATDCDDTCERMMRAVGVTPGQSDGETNYFGGETGRRNVGVGYLMSQLKAGRPAMIGVDYKPGSGGGRDAQRGTDHFLVATGFGVDEKGRQFISFNDPADGSGSNSPSNRLYLNPNTGDWSQSPDVRQPYKLSAVVNNR